MASPAPAPSWPSGARGLRVPAQSARGFTLVEMLLVIGLLLMMMVLAVDSFWGTFSAARSGDAADRLVALVRSCRAEAAQKGRKVQLTFDAATGQPVVAMELDRLTQPNVFTPIEAWWVEQAQLPDTVRVGSCELTGQSAFALQARSATSSDRQEELQRSPVTFTPDGSSDSARLVLAGQDADNPWQVEILVNGNDGTITSAPLAVEEAQGP